MKTSLKNKLIFSVSTVFRTISIQCASGPLIQTLLSVLGFSTKYIYLHSTLLQAANVLTIVLFSNFADKGKLFKRSAATLAVNAISFCFFIPLCLTRSSSPLVFLLFIGIAIVQSITTGLHTVCEYKIPYYVIKPNEYGLITSISGIISSIATLIMGAVISTASKHFAYEKIMIVAFAASFIMVSIGALSLLGYKNINENTIKIKDKKTIPLIKLFKEPVFMRFLPANLSRGISAGTITVLATIALDLGYDESVSSAMVSVQAIATLVGCAFFGWLSCKFFAGKLVWLGSAMFILLPLLLVKNSWLFLCICIVINFGKALIDYGVPSALIFIVPAEIAGPYNAWRMVLNNGGTLIGTALAAILPTWALLIVTLLLQIYSGITYLYAKNICGNK